IVATAEPVTDDQREQMRAAFGCPILAEYGSREGGLMAHECRHGRMHVLTPTTHIEILANGEPVPPGDVGEVVVTPLNTWAQPFIRYAQGDLAAFETEACPCGWPLPTLRLESGRVNGFIALPDGRLCSGVVASYILRDHAGVVRYHMHQRTLNLLQVRLVVDDDFDPRVFDVIRARCLRVLGPAIMVECSIVDDIPPNPSGKRCDFMSDVAADMTTFEIVPAQTLLRQAGTTA
ncbi:MAG: phenylacetate--CoA ligase family protein, partial [Phycisphaerae bacterium]|nr:phenylacetate--CoA ligase family protein [Phycisphaerae bacterium]